jgi:hypothetical protein
MWTNGSTTGVVRQGPGPGSVRPVDNGIPAVDGPQTGRTAPAGRGGPLAASRVEPGRRLGSRSADAYVPSLDAGQRDVREELVRGADAGSAAVGPRPGIVPGAPAAARPEAVAGEGLVR